ncbi:MAG: MOSC domain-containing protein [Bacteroidota bacterium]
MPFEPGQPAPTLLAIFTAPTAGAPMQTVQSCRAVPGRGLEGDRYFEGAGSFSRWLGPHRDVTFIAREDVEWIEATHDLGVPARDYRRNLLVEGVEMQDLIGRTFSVGDITFRGERWCQPCKALGRRLGIADFIRKTSRRTGIRARILTEGLIYVGDELAMLDVKRAGRFSDLT